MSAYSFVDTTEPFPAALMPAEAICFSGVWLDDAIEGFRTLNVQGRELLSKNIDTYSTGKKYGEAFRKATYEPRIITVTYQLKASTDDMFRTYFNMLNQCLMAEEAQLIFADEADKYFIATKASNSDIDPGLNSIIGTIEFYCADPCKYSIIKKIFPAQKINNVFRTRIENNGTVSVPISYTIKNKDENGYIGIVTPKGVIQLGKAAEADGQIYESDEVLTTPSATRKIFVPTGWKVDKGKLCWSDVVDTSGSLGTVTVTVEDPDDPTTALRMTAEGSRKGGLSGGMWSFDVKDSNGNGALDFYAYADIWFESGLPGQTGAQVIAFADANSRLIAAQVIYKIDEVGINTGTEFWVGDGSGGRRCVKSFSFEGASNYNKNPYGEPNGWSDILKESGDIRFYYDKRYYTYHVPELVNSRVAKVQLFIGQYDGRGKETPTYVSRNYFRRVGLKILGVSKWKDSVNRYQPGDEISIDGNSRKIYVNGMIRMQDEVAGSSYPEADPGNMDIEFYYSDFCGIDPEISAIIQEAWI